MSAPTYAAGCTGPGSCWSSRSASLVGAAVGVATGSRPTGTVGSAGFTRVSTVALVIASLYALRALQDRVDRALGRRSRARQPRAPGAAGDPGAADAAAVRHLLLHQHRGLAGRGRPDLGRPRRHRALLRPGRGVLPGGPARRGARRRRRHRRHRGGRRRLRRHAARVRRPRPRRAAHRPRCRLPGRRAREGQPGPGPRDRPGGPGPAPVGRGLAVLHGLRRRWPSTTRSSRAGSGSRPDYPLLDGFVSVQLAKVAIFLGLVQRPVLHRLRRHRRDVPPAVLHRDPSRARAGGRRPGGLPPPARRARRGRRPTVTGGGMPAPPAPAG